MCLVITINLALTLILSNSLAWQQHLVLLAVCLLEVLLKTLSYGPLGYVSSRTDAFDLIVLMLMLALIPLALSDYVSNDRLNLFLIRAGGVIQFVRVPRLLQHWRFLRDALRPTRALLDTHKLNRCLGLVT